MTRTKTILKTLQAVLLVTVLTPAISHADPSTRMMLAQAQTQSQDQAVKGEVKKLNRGLILGTAEAATSPNAQRPVEIPQVTAPVATPVAPTPVVATVEAPQIEIPALPPRKDDAIVAPATNNTFTTAAAPATDTPTTATPSVVTLPAPQLSTDTTTTTPVTTDVATTPAPVTPVAPVTVAPTPTTTTTTTNVDSAKIDTTKSNTAKADTTPVKPTSTKTAQTSHQHHAGDHSDDSVTIGGVKVNGGSQLKTIMNRSDVKSILSQYGLN